MAEDPSAELLHALKRGIQSHQFGFPREKWTRAQLSRPPVLIRRSSTRAHFIRQQSKQSHPHAPQHPP